jgi:DHA2 family multidrug resistance protein
VFYVNLPFGIAAVTGIALFLRDTHRDSTLKFDWTGFAVLAMGLGALQLLLDRGSDKDWFNSGEIIAEAVIAALGLYLFIVHMTTSTRPFIPREMFKDRNFVFSLMLMFAVGMVMLASTALLPPYLQNLGGYSVTDTGLLLAPRGVGTMFAMMFAGRLAMRADPRYVMGTGALLLLWSMWEMSTWTPSISAWTLVDTTFVQGIGMGLVFVPMNLIGFATLPPIYRTDGSALINLVRNVGSAIGISITTTYLANDIQTMHSHLAEHVNMFNRNLTVNAQSLMWDPMLPFGAAQIDGLVNQNAQIIAYADDFLFMFVASIPMLLVIFMMRRPPVVPPTQKVELEVME